MERKRPFVIRRSNMCIASNANIIIMNPVVVHPKSGIHKKFYTLSW